MPPAARNKPSSPCTKVCVLDAASGLCCGCGRTRDEIAAWGSLSEPMRRAVMAGLGARLREAGLSIIPRSVPRFAVENDAAARRSEQASVGEATEARSVPVEEPLAS